MKSITTAVLVVALAASASAQQGRAARGQRAAGAAGRPAAQESGGALVDRIFERFVEAQGGLQAMTRIKTRVMRGMATHSRSNLPGTVEYYSKAPDKSLGVITAPSGVQVLEGYDGKSVWLQTPFMGTTVLEQSTVILARGAEFGRVPKATEMYASVSYRGRVMVEGRETHLVQAARAGEPAQLLYFDVKDGLLRRADVKLPPQVAEGVKATVLYDTYAEVDGVKIPINYRLVYPEYTLTMKMYEVKHNVNIDDSLFTKPQGPRTN